MVGWVVEKVVVVRRAVLLSHLQSVVWWCWFCSPPPPLRAWLTRKRMGIGPVFRQLMQSEMCKGCVSNGKS